MKKEPLPILLAQDMNLERFGEKRNSAIKKHVVALAEKLGLPINLVHVDDLVNYPVNSHYYKPFIDRLIQERKKNLARLSHSSHVKMRPLFLTGSVLPTLLTLSKRQKQYELMAVGTHGRRGISRMILGSVSEELVRNSSLPVLVVGAVAQKHAPRMSDLGSKILLATDLGPSSKRAQDRALWLAQKTGMKLVLFHSLFEGLHIVYQTAFVSSRGRRELDLLLKGLEHNARAQMEKIKKLVETHGVSCDVVLENRPLETSSAILSLLKSKSKFPFAIVVMGTHARNLLSQAFLGSTIREVILESPVPVFSVHP